MSLVGPRPALPSETESWSPEVAARLRAKLALPVCGQVSGRHELAFDDYIRYDLFYVENWSLSLDLQIMARTVPALLSRAGRSSLLQAQASDRVAASLEVLLQRS